VRFENGKDVAVGRSAGVRVQPDGENGSVKVGRQPDGISERGGKATGRRPSVRKWYLRFEGSKQWFNNGGSDSPKGLLNYADFSRLGMRGRGAGRTMLRTSGKGIQLGIVGTGRGLWAL
jgi:hypothetical protein